jgi:cell division protein ZapA (FtsZ GTPase activity inhibitor)
MRCGGLNKSSKCFYFWRSFSGRFLAPLIVLLIAGKTPLLSQDSGPKSNSSGGISQAFDLSLETLNSLRGQASNQLTELTLSLNQAFQEVQASRQQLTSLRNLLDNALQKSIDLENTNQRILEFNQQIGERMQKRDEELASAYDELDSKDKEILKLKTVLVVLGLGCIGFIAFSIIKLLIKLRVLHP